MSMENAFILNNLIKIDIRIEEILLHFNFSDEAKKNIINKKLDVTGALGLLLEKKLYADAISLIAHGLPKRECIWWGYLCACQVDKDNASENMLRALELIKEWVFNPNEITRRGLERFPSLLEFKSPSAWMAMAVFWSGGNIAAEESGAQVLPDEHLYAKAVVGSITLAAALMAPESLVQNYEKFLTQGLDIANGGNGGGINGVTNCSYY